ncbi:hypothetical protein SAMN05216330_112142 [Bradyrhizobium sp. Ghvi]|uniref:hypothetical protein n=1 Tax=Bradyrhizobium sp. Ghvi TaxID=1855319 RepID=UPI0008E6931D|nr:hypothetical protein [Bradyrhizobium sp. Ghvi]SFP94828.1 hypothetical protein SAMN05216330_112142 [Bradyrhizobium sp. Ghvi]
MAIKEQMQIELELISGMLTDALDEVDAYEGRDGPDHLTRGAMTTSLRKFFSTCDEAGRVVATRFIINRLLIDVWRHDNNLRSHKQEGPHHA